MDRWKRPPTVVHSHGGRDEDGPYLGSLEVNETRCRGAMMNFNQLTPGILSVPIPGLIG
jgi:hypothetical protein